jgi:hypothetical protein
MRRDDFAQRGQIVLRGFVKRHLLGFTRLAERRATRKPKQRGGQGQPPGNCFTPRFRSVVLHGKATIAACPNKNRPILRRSDNEFPASGSTMCKNMVARKKAEALSALI